MFANFLQNIFTFIHKFTDAKGPEIFLSNRFKTLSPFQSLYICTYFTQRHSRNLIKKNFSLNFYEDHESLQVST